MRQRSAQRMERRIESAACSGVAGNAVHSSSTMVMLESRRSWISIERSGVSMCFEPSICERNSTPFSLIFLRSESDIAWKPPLSVRIGPGQFMNLWRPPKLATRSAPGRSIK